MNNNDYENVRNVGNVHKKGKTTGNTLESNAKENFAAKVLTYGKGGSMAMN